MKRIMYFSLATLASYLTGFMLFMVFYEYVYQMEINSLDNIIFWTFLSHMCVVIPFYLAAHALLKEYHRSTIFLRALIYVIFSFFPTCITFFIGNGTIILSPSILFSSEAYPFIVFITGTALVFSFSIWGEKKKLARNLFIIFSTIVIFSNIIIMNIV